MTQTTANPLVSVVIITRDRPQSLQNCVCSILDSIYKNIEIVILDNGSEDLKRITRNFLPALNADCLIKYIETYPKGFAVLRQEAVAQTAGEIIMSIDDDCVADREAITHIVARFAADPQIGIVGGQLTNVGFKGQREFKGRGRIGVNGTFEQVEEHNQAEVFGSANMSIRRAAFEAVGGYDLFFAAGLEEADLTLRIKRRGYTIVYEPAVKISHFHTPAHFKGANIKRNPAATRLYLFFKHFMPMGLKGWIRFGVDETRLLAHDVYNLTLKGLFRTGTRLTPQVHPEEGKGSSQVNRKNRVSHIVNTLSQRLVGLTLVLAARMAIPVLVWKARRAMKNF